MEGKRVFFVAHLSFEKGALIWVLFDLQKTNGCFSVRRRLEKEPMQWPKMIADRIQHLRLGCFMCRVLLLPLLGGSSHLASG